MIVCVCEAVGHREIEQHADHGCKTVRDVGERCGAGTGCGMCVSQIRTMLKARASGPQVRPSRERPFLSK